MNQAGLIDVWKLVVTILARQGPFEQIMIVVGAVLFVVMAIEGLRTSILAMRSGAIDPPERPGSETRAMAAQADGAPTTRLTAAMAPQRQAARPVRKTERRPAPASKERLTTAIRRNPKSDSDAYSSETAGY
jgi:hypothetical protein